MLQAPEVETVETAASTAVDYRSIEHYRAVPCMGVDGTPNLGYLDSAEIHPASVIREPAETHDFLVIIRAEADPMVGIDDRIVWGKFHLAPAFPSYPHFVVEDGADGPVDRLLGWVVECKRVGG